MGYVEVLCQLLSHQHSGDSKAASATVALYCAIIAGQAKAARLLLDHGECAYIPSISICWAESKNQTLSFWITCLFQGNK